MNIGWLILPQAVQKNKCFTHVVFIFGVSVIGLTATVHTFGNC